MGVKFNWYVGTAESALVYLTGVNRRDFFLDAETCRLVYDRGRKALLDLFGTGSAARAGCAGISYGHMRPSAPGDLSGRFGAQCRADVFQP
jgi:hypothetical protein